MKDKAKYKIKENYQDYSSGRVLYGAPGATNFPVILTKEIFEQCLKYLRENGNLGPYTVYDPFCGAGYSLTVMGIIYGSNIKKIFASDADKTILEFAHKNLSLLNAKGIDTRIFELKKFIKKYNKDSHKEALESAGRLRVGIQFLNIKIIEFKFNILSDTDLPKEVSEVDIVITDVPYGKLTSWSGAKGDVNPVQTSLNKIKDRLSKVSIAAIVLDKKQEILHEGYTKIKSYKSLKRRIVLLKHNN